MKRFKRKYEQAARGHGSISSRLLMLGLTSPFYFILRSGEATYEYFILNKTEKVEHMVRGAVGSAITGGFIMDLLLMATVLFLTAYVGMSSFALPEMYLIAYAAFVFGTQGLVKGKDTARMETLINEDKNSPGRIEKLESDLRTSSEQKGVLRMYKLATQNLAQPIKHDCDDTNANTHNADHACK